jgi:hypothetical protein
MRKQVFDDEPGILSTYFDGLDPSLHYLFVMKNSENVDNKKKLVKMSSRQYYHDTKFNWNKGKQEQSYKKHQELYAVGQD